MAAGLKPGDTGIVTYDSAKVLGDDGQVRSLMIQYITDNKTVSPTVANNWKISIVPVREEAVKEIVYIIQPGDCLHVIGEKFGVPYMEIARINHITNVDLIFAGEKLIIPAK